MKKFVCLLFLGVVISFHSQATAFRLAVDSLERGMVKVQAAGYDSLFSAYLPQLATGVDSAQHAAFVRFLFKNTQEHAQANEQAAAWYAASWFARNLTSNYAQALYGYNKAFEQAELAQDRVLMANAMLRSMETFIELGSFEEALQYLFKAEAVFQKYNYEGFRSVTNSLFGIGQFFHRAGNHTLSVQYFEKALVFNDLHDDDYSVMHAYNTLGLSYLGLKQFQKAVEVFQISNQMAREMGDVGWEALTYGNMGMVYFEQKDYSRAEEHLLYDIATSERVAGWASACNAAILLAEMYLEMQRTKQAATYIQFAREFEAKAPALYLKQFIADLEVDYWVMLKNFDKAYFAKLEFDRLNQELGAKNEQQTRLQAEKRHAYEIQKMALDLELAKDAQTGESSQWQKVVLLLGLLLLTLAAAAFGLLEREKKAQKLLLKDLQQFQLTRQLQQFKRMMHHQYRLQQGSSEILPSPDGWKDQLREITDSLYQQFFSRMKSSFPSLTEVDIEVMALIKLKFEVEEVASLLGLEMMHWQEGMTKKLGGVPAERIVDEIRALS